MVMFFDVPRSPWNRSRARVCVWECVSVRAARSSARTSWSHFQRFTALCGEKTADGLWQQWHARMVPCLHRRAVATLEGVFTGATRDATRWSPLDHDLYELTSPVFLSLPFCCKYVARGMDGDWTAWCPAGYSGMTIWRLLCCRVLKSRGDTQKVLQPRASTRVLHAAT